MVSTSTRVAPSPVVPSSGPSFEATLRVASRPPIPGRPTFRFANIDYVEILRELEPDDAAIRLGVPPMMTTRPEGLWDEPGPLDLSNLAHDPARLNLLQKHTRFRA